MPEQSESTQQPKSIAETLARLQGRIEQGGFGDVVPEAEAPCETCNSKRFVTATDRTNPNAPARIVPCPTCRPVQLAEYKQRLYQSRLQRTRLPKKYQDVSLDDWGDPSHSSRQGKVTAFLAMWAMVNHPKHMVSSHAIAHDLCGIFGNVPDWVTAMLDEPDDVRPGVALYGTYGVGKTWLAAAAMNELTSHGASVLYMRMSHLVQSLRDTWKSEERTGDLIREYTTIPILFIDDMSDNSPHDRPLSPHQQDFAAQIMRERMGDERPTIVTTNWEPNIFTKKWGQVCADVMLEGLHWLEVSGEKLRDTKTKWGNL